MSGYSTSEVGHAKNVANFSDLIGFCEGFGSTYNPNNGIITISELRDLHVRAENALQNVYNAKAPLTVAINKRQELFSTLKPLSVRVIGSLTASTQDKRIVDDAKTYARKIQGRAPKVRTDEGQEGQEVARMVSNSQQSYDNLVEHLTQLTRLLKEVPEYAPNEAEIGVASLDNLQNSLRQSNSDVQSVYVPYVQMLNERNKLLYDPAEGLVAVAKMVKQYVKSVFGVRSPEYERVNGVPFRMRS